MGASLHPLPRRPAAPPRLRRPRPSGGSYPPPPPPSGGYAPPAPGPAIRTLPTDSYAPWLSRALAFLIDILPYAVVHGIGIAIMAATQQSACVTDVTQYTVNQYCSTQNSTIGMLAQWLASTDRGDLPGLELRLPPGHHRVEPRQIGHEVQGGQ